MGAPKGRKKAGGRAKGTQNKKTLALYGSIEERSKALGVDPFEIMLLFAKGDWRALDYPSEMRETRAIDGKVVKGTEYITPAMRLDAAKDACKYLYAQKKAVEHSGPDGKSINVNTGETWQLVQDLVQMVTGYADEKRAK